MNKEENTPRIIAIESNEHNNNEDLGPYISKDVKEKHFEAHSTPESRKVLQDFKEHPEKFKVVEDFDTENPDFKNLSSSAYTHTYTTFSGCDTVVAFNGRIVGEINGITMSLDDIDLLKNVSEGTAIIKYLMFGLNSDYPTPYLPNNDLLLLVYANEYGNACCDVYYDLIATKYKHRISVDDIQGVEEVECRVKAIPNMIRISVDPYIPVSAKCDADNTKVIEEAKAFSFDYITKHAGSDSAAIKTLTRVYNAKHFNLVDYCSYKATRLLIEKGVYIA